MVIIEVSKLELGPFMTCTSPTFPTPTGVSFNRPSNNSSGGCNGFFRPSNREEPCCGSEPTVEVLFSSDTECPEGSIPSIVIEAKSNPLFSAIFSCYDDESLRSFLCCMEQFRVPGCGDLTVLLAAAHFFTLLTSGNRLANTTMNSQSKKGIPLEAVSAEIDPNTQWNLSMYGIMYSNFRKPMKAYLGMAWGI